MKRVALVLALVLLPALGSAQVSIVAAERAKYGPRVSPADAPKLLTAIARALPHGPWGLLVKTSGNNCGGFACDIVCSPSEHFDVLIDGPDAAESYAGTARPSWQPKGPYAPRVCNFIVGDPGPAPGPKPDPVPAPVTCDTSKAERAAADAQAAAELSLEACVEARDQIIAHRQAVQGEYGKAKSLFKNWKTYVVIVGSAIGGWLGKQEAAK